MHLILQRLDDDGEATIGELLLDGERLCYTLEDEARAEKVRGETRIPAGLYGLERKQVGESRFDHGARQIMGVDGHIGMIRLKDVPGFSEILIHWGNFEKDTAGCILVGRTRGVTNGVHSVGKSRLAYKDIYPLIAKAIGCEHVTLQVVDENGATAVPHEGLIS